MAQTKEQRLSSGGGRTPRLRLLTSTSSSGTTSSSPGTLDPVQGTPSSDAAPSNFKPTNDEHAPPRVPRVLPHFCFEASGSDACGSDASQVKVLEVNECTNDTSGTKPPVEHNTEPSREDDISSSCRKKRMRPDEQSLSNTEDDCRKKQRHPDEISLEWKKLEFEERKLALEKKKLDLERRKLKLEQARFLLNYLGPGRSLEEIEEHKAVILSE